MLDGAKKTVRCSAYSFTAAHVANALVRAHERKIDVGVILDPGDVSARGSQLPTLLAAGVPTWIDRAHSLQHQKTCTVDGIDTEVGSANYSAAGLCVGVTGKSCNGENVNFIHLRAVAAKYEQNWQTHRSHSEAP